VAHVDISRVEESELERRFKVALRDWAKLPDNDDVTLENVPAPHGREAFDLRIGDTNVVRWKLEEQEGLSSNQSTLPDFLFTRADSESRKIAIYLDGFQFHGSSANNQIAGDSRKRTDLRNSGHIVWNLTWEDVEGFHKAVAADPPSRVPPRPLLTGKGRTAAMRVQSAQVGVFDYSVVDQNPMAMLLSFLGNPSDDDWERLARSAIAGAVADASRQTQLGAEQVTPAISAALSRTAFDASSASGAIPKVLLVETLTQSKHSIVATVNVNRINLEEWTVFSILDDDESVLASEDHRKRWRDWLQWSNVLQFLRTGASAYVVGGVSQHSELMADLDNLPLLGGLVGPTTEEPVSSAPPTGVVLEADVIEELDFIDPDIASLVQRVLEMGAPPFVGGHEVDGVPLEAAWPSHRVAVLLDGQAAPTDWTAHDLQGWDESALLQALRDSE